jgi:uncharacterized RDD family membrane protein YckC
LPYCQNCGKEVTPDSAFCASCGARVSSAFGSPPLSGIDALIKEKAAQEYWIRRFLAFVIDAVVVFAAIALFVALVSIPPILLGYVPGTLPLNWLAAGAFSALFSLIFLVYFVVAETAYGRSIGKHFLGLKVATTAGRNPEVGASFIRNLSKIYWALLFLDVAVGLATSKDYKEKFSDRYTRLSVVQR